MYDFFRPTLFGLIYFLGLIILLGWGGGPGVGVGGSPQIHTGLGYHLEFCPPTIILWLIIFNEFLIEV